MHSSLQENLGTNFVGAMVEALAHRCHVLHGLGQLDEALETINEAESLHRSLSSVYPPLYGLPGFYKFTLLLEQARDRGMLGVILNLVASKQKLSRDNIWPLYESLTLLIMGQCHAGLNAPDLARNHLDHAVRSMMVAGHVLYQPMVLLVRGRFRREYQEAGGAWQDLETARSIAENSGMQPMLAECALLAGNLFLDAGDIESAMQEFETAFFIIENTNYDRRRVELLLLDTRLKFYAGKSEEARTNLVKVWKLLEVGGQWGLAPLVESVSKEIVLVQRKMD